MNQPIFPRYLLYAALGAASLVVTACGGGSGGDETFAVQPNARALALGETTTATADADVNVSVDAQRPGELLAADAGAAMQEPK